MENEPFTELKINIQKIIDLIANKQIKEASIALTEVSTVLDELLDHAETNDMLQEISRYQVLLNHLHQKINASQQ